MADQLEFKNTNPSEILPQPNLVIFLPNYVIVTIKSIVYGIVAVVNGVRGDAVTTEKFQWKDGSLQTFINHLCWDLEGDLTISTVLSYNNDSEFVLYSRRREMVTLTKKEIAERLGIPESNLKIV